jgi:hypothetical protein
MSGVDYREMLKHCILGMICHYDIPAVPTTFGDDGQGGDCSREELELFFDLLDEVVTELGEASPRLKREIARLEREHLGLDA